MEKAHNVLWTGGWDSTFRIIQLYSSGATIHPIYVFDHNRTSSTKELEVITKLTQKIPLKFKQSKGKILPLTLIRRKDIPSDFFLKYIHKTLRFKLGIGKQYYWLACLAKTYQYKNLEVSFHQEDLDKFFLKEQLIEFKDDQLLLNWRINPKKIISLKDIFFST